MLPYPSCRYSLFGEYISNVLSMLDTAVDRGMTNHIASMGGVLASQYLLTL